jgi:hypothetical protein
MSRKQQTHDLQASLGTESGEPVRATGDQERVGLYHISMIAEIRLYCHPFLLETLLPSCSSPRLEPLLACETPLLFAFDRVPRAWDTFSSGFL